MKKNVPVIKGYLSILLLFILQACSREPHINNGRLVSIEAKQIVNELFYAGTIQPLNTIIIPSPADGVIMEMPIQYGEPVKKGQLLFTLSSAKFLSEYKTSLLNYLKAKSDFNHSKVQLEEGLLLHKNELISDDDFKAKQTNYYASQLALLQAKDALQVFIQQLGIKDEVIYQLSIADIDKIDKMMRLQMSRDYLRVFASQDGTLLSPIKNTEETAKLMKGDVVKQGDVLAMIGDMNGISVHIKVNEMVVNQLKEGQKIKITGIAFQDETLLGKINRVERQGEVVNGALPNFEVEVIVPTLSEKQRRLIHVGMSAKIQITVEETQQIMVPMKALNEIDGEPYVQIYNNKTRAIQRVSVKTGKTTIDSVAILSGLKIGDVLVVPN